MVRLRPPRPLPSLAPLLLLLALATRGAEGLRADRLQGAVPAPAGGAAAALEDVTWPEAFDGEPTDLLNPTELVELEREEATGRGSSTARNVSIIFFAGLEGTGHHLVQAIARKVQKFKQCPVTWACREPWEEKYLVRQQRIFQALRSGIYSLPLQMSYPMCGVNVSGGYNHTDRMERLHPRLDWLAEAASRAHVKLSVVMLHRPLGQALAANCLRRTFEPCEDEAEVMAANADILARQLQLLPRSSRSCFRFGEPASMLAALRRTFGPERVPEDVIQSVWQESKLAAGPEIDSAALEKLVQRLGGPQAKLDELCNESEAVDANVLVRQVVSLGDIGARHLEGDA